MRPQPLLALFREPLQEALQDRFGYLCQRHLHTLRTLRSLDLQVCWPIKHRALAWLSSMAVVL